MRLPMVCLIEFYMIVKLEIVAIDVKGFSVRVLFNFIWYNRSYLGQPIKVGGLQMTF